MVTQPVWGENTKAPWRGKPGSSVSLAWVRIPLWLPCWMTPGKLLPLSEPLFPSVKWGEDDYLPGSSVGLAVYRPQDKNQPSRASHSHPHSLLCTSAPPPSPPDHPPHPLTSSAIAAQNSLLSAPLQSHHVALWLQPLQWLPSHSESLQMCFPGLQGPTRLADLLSSPPLLPPLRSLALPTTAPPGLVKPLPLLWPVTCQPATPGVLRGGTVLPTSPCLGEHNPKSETQPGA